MQWRRWGIIAGRSRLVQKPSLFKQSLRVRQVQVSCILKTPPDNGGNCHLVALSECTRLKKPNTVISNEHSGGNIMSTLIRSSRTLMCQVALALTLALILPLVQMPHVYAQEEKSNSTPTGWWWLVNVSAEQVADKISDGFRVFDLDVVQAAPLRFNAVLIRNQGIHQKGWWWYYGVSPAFISEKLNENKARLIDLESYWVNGEQRFAVVMVPNTGDDGKAWWWYYNVSASFVADKLSENQARLIDIETEVINGERRYSVVMIKNQGADSKAWWWYYNVTPQFISDTLSENKARLVDIEHHGDGRFTVIMEKTQGEYWWWYYGISSISQLSEFIDQNGARIIDLERYNDSNGNTRYAALLLNNSNAITTRVGQQLRSGSDGQVGLYLKQVGGPVLASLQHRFVFEPASTIKVVPHLYAMRQVQSGNASLNDMLPHYTDAATSCPTTTQSGTEALSTVLTRMMRNSDNARTRAVIDTYGQANINTMAQSTVGMTDSSINHVIGCGGPTPNELTLHDVGLLYEGVAAGSLLNAQHREQFFALMSGPSWSKLNQIIEAEAPASLSDAQQQQFQGQVRTFLKGGSYGVNGLAYRSHAGWAQIPFCVNGVMQPRQYVYGIFIHAATNSQAASDTIDSVGGELLREQIRAGLANWSACSQQSYLAPGLIEARVSNDTIGVEFRATSARLIPAEGLVVELQEEPRLPIPDPGPLRIIREKLFELRLFDASNATELTELPASYELRIQYSDEQLAAAGIGDENTLQLFYLDGQEWKAAGVDQINTQMNEIITTLNHASVFALGASNSTTTTTSVFLPLVIR